MCNFISEIKGLKLYGHLPILLWGGGIEVVVGYHGPDSDLIK